jgi:hypothetical protein
MRTSYSQLSPCPPETESTISITSTTSTTSLTTTSFRRSRKPLQSNTIEPYRETECVSTARLSNGRVRTKVKRRTTTVYGSGDIRVSEVVIYRRSLEPDHWNTRRPASSAERERSSSSDSSDSASSADSSRSPSPASRGGVHTSFSQGRVRPATSSSSGNTPSTSGKNSTTVRSSSTFEPEVAHSAAASSPAAIGKAEPRRPAPPRKTATSILP